MRTYKTKPVQTNDGFDVLELNHQPVDTEQELESILHQNPELLLNEQVLIFSRQPSLDPGVPDLLAFDKFGNVVVIELKKGLSGTGSASEESIISQPQQYARALAPYDYSALDELYQQYCQQVRTDEWDVDSSAIPAESLDDAFEQVFGQPLKPEWFNQQQRLVILAEEITDQTAQNARYLQEQGLNLQCQEVRLYNDPDKQTGFLVSNVVVDYDLREVRPDRYGKPTYEDISRQIVDRTLGYVGDLVHAQNPDAVVSDFSRRQPVLQSQNPDHPDAIEYSLRVKPVENGTVRVALDVKNGDELVETVRNTEQQFREQGFEVSHSRSTNRVVQCSWEINTVEPLYDEGMQDEIASKFAELIEIGHEVFNATQ
jgi:hypothetical protein